MTTVCTDDDRSVPDHDVPWPEQLTARQRALVGLDDEHDGEGSA